MDTPVIFVVLYLVAHAFLGLGAGHRVALVIARYKYPEDHSREQFRKLHWTEVVGLISFGYIFAHHYIW